MSSDINFSGGNAVWVHILFFKANAEECFKPTRVAIVKIRGNCRGNPHTSSQDIRGVVYWQFLQEEEGGEAQPANKIKHIHTKKKRHIILNFHI